MDKFCFMKFQILMVSSTFLIQLLLVPLYSKKLDKFHFYRLARRPNTQQPVTKHDKDFDVMVLDVIRVAMTSEVKISEGWIRAIENAHGGLKSHDIMVLLLLHNLPNRKKAVEALIKNKIRAGELTEELVKKSLKNHATFIKAEFESVQAIAQMLMTSTERALSQFSMVLFVQVSLNKKVFTKINIPSFNVFILQGNS